MKPRVVSEILRNLSEAARLTDAAVADTRHAMAERQLGAARNVVVFGKRVLGLLHELGNADPGFADLFAQNRLAMTDDPKIQRFDLLAVEMLRERSPQLNVTHLAIPSAGAKFGSRPPNARVFFSGDRLGGSGWELVMGDGSIEKHYLTLPADFLPKSFKLSAVAGPDSVQELCDEFVSHLSEMIRNARQYFE